jgi:hypothetical protein
MERELYNLKTKILRSKHISDQLREELANDVFEIEKLANKTNDIHSVSKCSCKFQNCNNWEKVITTCKDCKKPIK